MRRGDDSICKAVSEEGIFICIDLSLNLLMIGIIMLFIIQKYIPVSINVFLRQKYYCRKLFHLMRIIFYNAFSNIELAVVCRQC